MELPSFSFHASLEEQWDEEEDKEEIESVLKVVPPAYHQYLDVFSKVKAEKLPPHRACDHHIELEGLLSPVGDIYSLSKNESEKLQAYISENVEKGFIRPSSSSTGAPVLFVKKKDGGICLCVNYLKLNAISRKNRYPVPPMNQLLTIFNGSTIFSKIDLHDNSSLQYFMLSKVLTCLQACWAEFPSEFPFSITYRPGRLATLPDALSRWDNLYPDGGVDFISKNPQSFHQILKKNEIKESRLSSIKVGVFSDLVDQIQKAGWQGKAYKEILKQLARGGSVSYYNLEPQTKLVLFEDRVVIPSNNELQLDILQKCHDSPLAGHPGQEKTLNLIKRGLLLGWHESNYQGLCVLMSAMFKKQTQSP
ncbi:hypothetical protein O181_021784 [Austropuccinia psidii MF-1]|uniref:Integrase zinc-binding domain-containing protein n=1 Tax=Austropuccinia psidii MF-1 TaxID=1389203 RepID=A0A9Q3CBD2_9BASI|nr:hypothetical protein [Austropuccinia psidii MF-1]